MSDETPPAAPAPRIGEMLAKTPVDARIAMLIAPLIGEMGYELVRVRLTGAKRPTLQIMIDKEPNGVEVEDCAEASRAVSALLDVEDPINREYVLEMSSPGVDRPLTRLKDFERFAGFEAKLELREAVDGRKRYRGVVLGADLEAGQIALELEDGERLAFAFDDLGDAKLVMTEELIRASLRGEFGGRAGDGAAVDVDAESGEEDAVAFEIDEADGDVTEDLDAETSDEQKER